MKRFGFHPEHLYYKIRKPTKVRYLETKELGKFEVPMKPKERNLHRLHAEYQKRLEFEKYLCPKGVKPTITSRFTQERDEIECFTVTFRNQRHLVQHLLRGRDQRARPSERD